MVPERRGDGPPLYLYRATSFIARYRGLHALPELEVSTGLLIMPCWAVHTFGLRSAIDVVFLDRQLRVTKLVSMLPPARIAMCLGAYCVVELSAGYCAAVPDYAKRISQAARCAVG